MRRASNVTAGIYIIDRRTPTPMGHVPSEDILGGFQVSQGVLVQDSYQPMKSPKIVSERGMFQLDNFLHPRLLEALKQLPAPAPPQSAER